MSSDVCFARGSRTSVAFCGPDIAAVVGVLGSLLVTHPRKVVEWSHQVWRYLAATVEHKVVLGRSAGQTPRIFELSVSADASFAPGGDKSRSGVVAILPCPVEHYQTISCIAVSF